MEQASAGELVSITGEGPDVDGIVFDVPSRTKAVVAVVDRSRGPVFRTVHPKVLRERADESPDDRALQLLIRRTPAPGGATASGRSGAGRANPGHTRTAMHRTTGK